VVRVCAANLSLFVDQNKNIKKEKRWQRVHTGVRNHSAPRYNIKS